MEVLAAPQLSVPEIAISPAPAQESLPEPFSPFAASQPPTPTLSATMDDDGYRSSLLSPPPVMSTRFLRQHSPLIPETIKANVGPGLDADRFQRLLAASKERNTALVGKKAPDLRKEIAIKTHKSKQLERRALFLSKVAAPPSPTATLLPKTPPESPAIFHYSMPSPGLQSPLAIYDHVNSPESAMITPWVEQVDFRREPEQKKSRSRGLPSLDQIQSRLATHGQTNIRMEPTRSRPGLPAFLRAPSPPRIVVESEPEFDSEEVKAVPVQELSRPRLVLPKRERVQQPPTPRPVLPSVRGSRSPQMPTFAQLMPTSPKRRSPKPAPLEPASLQITTTVIPSTPRKRSPTDFTASNLALLSSRARTGNNMMAALRRRTSSGAPAPAAASECARQLLSPIESEERKARRISAPAEMQRRGRDSFAHPVLALPGGF